MAGAVSYPAGEDRTAVTPLGIEDYDGAAAFLEEITERRFSKGFWLDRFEHWWEKNPAMAYAIERGWVIRDADGKIAGFIGSIPVGYSVNGIEKMACAVTSWYVKDEYAGRSLELLTPFLEQKRPEFLLDTTPVEKVEKMLLKLGFKRLERRWMRIDAFYPVDAALLWGYLAGKAARNKGIRAAVAAAGPFAAAALNALEWARGILRKDTDAEKYSISEIRSFDGSWSFFWERLKAANRVMAVRDEVRLNWFFFGSASLSSTRKVIGIRCGGSPVGYAAVKVMEVESNGRAYHYFEVVEMVILCQESAAYHAAFQGLIRLAREDERDIMLIRMSPFDRRMEGCMRGFGFFSRPGRSRFLYRMNGAGAGGGDGLEEGFYATALDGDRCFFP